MELSLEFCLKIIAVNVLANTLIDCYNLYIKKNFIYLNFYYKMNKTILIKILASIMLIGYSSNILINISLIILLLISEAYYFKKNINFKDASDSVQFFILLGLLLSQQNPILGIFFITLIVIVIYHLMGFFKLKSELWKNGDAIFKVMNTESFGSPAIALSLRNNPSVKKTISWGIILLQLTFPLSLVNQEFCLFYLLFGFVFHLMIMIVMKLHNFFLVFISTYPCIYFATLIIENSIGK